MSKRKSVSASPGPRIEDTARKMLETLHAHPDAFAVTSKHSGVKLIAFRSETVADIRLDYRRSRVSNRGAAVGAHGINRIRLRNAPRRKRK